MTSARTTARRQGRRLRPVAPAAALLVGGLVTGCGAGGHNGPQPNAAINPPTPVPVPTVTSTANATLALNRVLAGLRTHGLESQMTDIRVFSRGTDPARAIGRPGSYVARAGFTDRTLPAAARAQAGFARGGAVEIFTSSATALGSAGHGPDQMRGETDLVSGAVLLRLSPLAPNTLRETYRTALRETTGSPVQIVG